MAAHKTYKTYKKLSDGLFDSVPNDSSQDIYHYLRLHARYSKCAQMRTHYRDNYVPSTKRDAGHDYAIEAANKRAKEAEHILTNVPSKRSRNPDRRDK